ncbi:MAG TPA: glycosyltransferase [Anaerolineae bacterium]|nr:glycosyltransferase [Anaerolineae bacterium]
MPDFSIIIPAYNSTAWLPHCLKAVQQQTIDCARYEIIVVDDGSIDRTVSTAQEILKGNPSARVMTVPHGGPAAARNAGAQLAQGELVLFTDSDCEPAPDWIQTLTAAFQEPAVVGAKGVYRTQQRSLVARFVQQEYQVKYDQMRQLKAIDFIDTYSAAYRREAFLANGGFDETFTTASVEDQEFSFRLASRGYHLVFAPNAIVFHQHDASPLEYFRRKFHIGFWKAYVLRLHPDKIIHDSHTPQSEKVQMSLLALALGISATTLGFPYIIGWALAAWLLLALSMVPFLIKITQRDPLVLTIAPILIVLRAFALGLGLVAGLIRFSLKPPIPLNKP